MELGKWEEMEKWVTGGGYKGAMLQALVGIRKKDWERVGKSVENARREIDKEITSLAVESY